MDSRSLITEPIVYRAMMSYPTNETNNFREIEAIKRNREFRSDWINNDSSIDVLFVLITREHML